MKKTVARMVLGMSLALLTASSNWAKDLEFYPANVSIALSHDGQVSMDTINAWKIHEFSLEINPACVTATTQPDGFDYVSLPDATHLSQEGKPRLPVLTREITLRGQVSVLKVEATDQKILEVSPALTLVPAAASPAWEPGADVSRVLPDEQVYGTDAFWPGDLFSWTAGSDGEYTKIVLSIYPLQYNPARNQAFLVSKIRVRIQYQESTPPWAPKMSYWHDFSSRWTDPSVPLVPEINLQPDPTTPTEDPVTPERYNLVIIAPEAFKRAAEYLRDFHAGLEVPGLPEIFPDTKTTYGAEGGQENYVGAVVTTEEIAAAYPEIGDTTLPAGYNQRDSSVDRQVAPFDAATGVGYNYSLARKIVSFLADKAKHPDLKFVTLLGCDQFIPPSYYYAHGSYYRKEMIPTDFYYSSPDLDLVPNFRVGRLPARTREDARRIVIKIRNWKLQEQKDWIDEAGWTQNFTIAGGKAFPSAPIHIAETGCYYSTNQQGAWYRLTRNFQTNQTYTLENVKKILSGGQAGIFYLLEHGGGNKMYVGPSSYIAAEEMLTLPVSHRVPVVLSIACINAAFDCSIQRVQTDLKVSIGEAVVLSPAAGICYLGGSRSNHGMPTYHFDKENNLVLDGTTYLMNLLHNAIMAYQTPPEDGCVTLGEMAHQGRTGYLASGVNLQTDSTAMRNYFAWTLLGDPALYVPPRRREAASFAIPLVTAHVLDVPPAPGGPPVTPVTPAPSMNPGPGPTIPGNPPPVYLVATPSDASPLFPNPPATPTTPGTTMAQNKLTVTVKTKSPKVRVYLQEAQGYGGDMATIETKEIDNTGEQFDYSFTAKPGRYMLKILNVNGQGSEIEEGRVNVSNM